jgi:hypothetical protein
MTSLAFIVMLAVFQPLAASAGDEEIEIHRGEEFTSPGAGPKEELRFVRVFTVSWELWDRQPKANPRAKPPLPFSKALELAKASWDPAGTSGEDNVYLTKLELCTQPTRDPDDSSSVAFYVVNFHVDDGEVERVVLMDGTVVKPQLTRLPAPAENER